jgi:hypothetical protein
MKLPKDVLKWKLSVDEYRGGLTTIDLTQTRKSDSLGDHVSFYVYEVEDGWVIPGKRKSGRLGNSALYYVKDILPGGWTLSEGMKDRPDPTPKDMIITLKQRGAPYADLRYDGEHPGKWCKDSTVWQFISPKSGVIYEFNREDTSEMWVYIDREVKLPWRHN